MKGIIFDGNSILNRAFYGVRPLSTSDGTPTNACYGFISIVSRAMNEVQPDLAAIAFDLKEKTFRHKSYDFYKANRKGMPDELALQLPIAKELADALGLKIIEREGFEADDVIGSFAAECDRQGVDCVIITGDRDSYQLVSDKVTVHLSATNETRIITPDFINSTYGLKPHQLIDVKALMGDSSDNIPGVKGIGEKGAVKLISEYGDLDNLYAHADEIKGSLGEKLRADREMAYASRFLAKIVTDVPIGDISDCAYTGPNTKRLRALYTRLEFNKFLDALGEEPLSEAESHEYTPATANEISLLSDTLYISVSDGRLLATDGNKYLSCSFDADCEKIFGKDRKAVVWSVKELLHLLKQNGISADCDFVDISLMGYVMSTYDGGIELKKLVTAYLNVECVDETPDIYIPLLAAMEEKISDSARKLYSDIELPLSYTLFGMESVGFGIDSDGLKAYSKQLDVCMRLTEQKIYGLANHEFNINSPKQLGAVLFEELGLPKGKKTKSGYSTGAEVLEELRLLHPIIDEVLYFRQVAKLKSTYCDGLLKMISDDGRIHTTFKQTLTMTGRLSSAEPNLQNIPVRTELGRDLRKFFRAKDGHVLIDADYSQIELRILAALSGDETLINAFVNGDDIHLLTASQVFGIPMESVSAEMRKRAKTVNFGIIYGMGAYSLSRDLHISVKEASRYIAGYFEKYTGVKQYLERLIESAKKCGYVDTLFGRRRYIPELTAAKKQLNAFGERVAMNTPVQGTAADIIKIAMIKTEQALSAAGLKAKLILQIHDELIVEAPEAECEEAKKILVDSMQSAASLSVPLTVGCAVGKTWYDAKD